MRLASVAVLAHLTACRLVTGGDACPQGDGLRSGGYTGDDLPAKTLVVVLDGGPEAATGGIGDVLAAHAVQAAFFVEGQAAQREAGVLARLKTQGHLIGNRGYSGTALTVAVDPVSEVRKTDDLIAPHVSGDVFLLKPPSGRIDAALLERLAGAGLGRYVGPIVGGVGDTDGVVESRSCWAGRVSVETCAQTYLDRIRTKDHGFVVLDAEHEETGALLRIILPKLRDEGFTFVRLDQVASIRVALERNGAKPGTVGGPGGCQEYRP